MGKDKPNPKELARQRAAENRRREEREEERRMANERLERYWAAQREEDRRRQEEERRMRNERELWLLSKKKKDDNDKNNRKKIMDFKGPSEHVGTNSGLNIIKSENYDLVDPQMCDNQKHPPIGVRMAVYSNSNPFLSSGCTTSSGTVSSTTNSRNTSISYCYPPFPLLNNSLASSGRSLMDSTTKKYISPIILNTSTISACSLSSFSSPSSGTSSTIACGRLTPRSTTLKRKRECLTNLTAEQKLSRRKENNRLAAQSCRDRKKIQQCNLELTVARLHSENVQLLAKEAKLRDELDLVKVATRSLNTTTCPNCDYLHQVQGHGNFGHFQNG